MRSLQRTNPSAVSLLTEITKKFPVESWKHIIKYLGPPITSNSFWIEHWLRGDDYFKDQGGLELIPPEHVWNWVEADVKSRSSYLASFVPKTPFESNEHVCPREIISRYGLDKEVQRQLTINLDTGMISETMMEKRDRFLKIRAEEQNEQVKKWIDEYIGLTEKKDKFLKRIEERDFPDQTEPEIL